MTEVWLFVRSGYSNTRAVPCATQRLALEYLRNEAVLTWNRIPKNHRAEARRLIEADDLEGLETFLVILAQRDVYPIRLKVSSTPLRTLSVKPEPLPDPKDDA